MRSGGALEESKTLFQRTEELMNKNDEKRVCPDIPSLEDENYKQIYELEPTRGDLFSQPNSL